MADVAQISASASTEAPATPKKAAKKDKKIDRPKTNHPTTAIMVNGAVQNLKERGGSSLQAIKKYIATTYKIDAEKSSYFIRKYIRNAVVAGILIQTKGKGASGSFKLASTAVTNSAAKPEKANTRLAKKSDRNQVAKKGPVKKATKTRKSPAKRAAAKEVKPKLPLKAKKTAKSPTKKPKSPKPKTTKAAKVAKSPKKTSPRKK